MKNTLKKSADAAKKAAEKMWATGSAAEARIAAELADEARIAYEFSR